MASIKVLCFSLIFNLDILILFLGFSLIIKLGAFEPLWLNSYQTKKIALPLLTTLLFSGSFIAGKYTTFDLQPLTASLLRYFVALLFLTAITGFYGRTLVKIKLKDLTAFLILGLSGIVAYHYFFFLSLRYTDVTNAAIINALTPVITGVAAAIFIGERLTRSNYSGILIAFAGVIILLTRGKISNLAGLNMNSGDMLMLLSVISWVIYALIVKKLVKKYHGFTITYYSTLIGTILLFFLALPEDPLGQILQVSLVSVVAVVYMGIFASGIGYLLYNYSIKEIGPTKTSGFVYSCQPIFVAILAFIFFSQQITNFMIISAVLILTGLQFMLRDKV